MSEQPPARWRSLLENVLSEVRLERWRQDQKWGEQNHVDGKWADVGSDLEDAAREALSNEATWGAILLEEVGEALRASSPAELRAELIQVAAVAVSWVQAIDRRH